MLNVCQLTMAFWLNWLTVTLAVPWLWTLTEPLMTFAPSGPAKAGESEEAVSRAAEANNNLLLPTGKTRRECTVGSIDSWSIAEPPPTTSVSIIQSKVRSQRLSEWWGQTLQRDHRHLSETKQPGRCEPAVTGNHIAVSADENRVGKPERSDAACDLGDLRVAMRMR